MSLDSRQAVSSAEHVGSEQNEGQNKLASPLCASAWMETWSSFFCTKFTHRIASHRAPLPVIADHQLTTVTCV